MDVTVHEEQPATHRLRLPRRWPHRRWWIIAAAAIVVGVALGAVRALTSSAGTDPPYRAVAASTGTMQLSTAGTATLEPAQQSDLSFQVSGQVATVPVTLGQQVTAGQPLATITSASLAAQVDQAKATVANDEAKLNADQTAGASSTSLSADQAALTAAQAALANAQASLSDATLAAPIAGRVAQLNLTVGQQVAGSGGGGSGAAGGTAATSSSATGSASAQIVVVGPAFVANLAVDDTQIGLMKDGEQATIVPEGTNARVFGTVTSVGLLANSSSGVATFPVVVTVTGTPSGLYAGAPASVSVIYRQLSDVVEVPTAAVHYAGAKASVLESVAGKQVSVPVTVGVTAGGFTQITSGLTAGQQVLVPVTGTPRPTSSGAARPGNGFGPGGGGNGFGNGFGRPGTG